jgi:hypothetical protein
MAGKKGKKRTMKAETWINKVAKLLGKQDSIL